MEQETWYTGLGVEISFDNILCLVEEHSVMEGHVTIGTDSQVKKKDCVFSTAICLHGATGQMGSRYFFKKVLIKKSKYSTLLQRITEEVHRSVEIGMKILEVNPVIDIELHIDISGPGKNQKTSKFADMLVGYATGAGFDCRIKPYATAASSVADKHTK